MSRSVRQDNAHAKSREQARTAEGMPAGGWAAADLKLPAYWYHFMALAGIAFPVSGDERASRERGVGE